MCDQFRNVHRSVYLHSAGLVIAFLAAVGGLSSIAKADLPVLASNDSANPIYEGEPLQHNIESQVNIFKRTIYGFRYSIGSLVVEYDENSASSSADAVYRGNLLGNFDLGSYRFSSGYSIRFPVMFNDILKDGTVRYRLGDWQPSNDGWQFRILGSTGSQQSGRYVVRASGSTVTSIHDTQELVAYRMTNAPVAGVRRPYEAVFDDGSVVSITWNDSLSTNRRFVPASLRLVRNGAELENVTFGWFNDGSGVRMNTIRSTLNSIAAPFLSVDLGYTATPRVPSQLLSSVRLASNAGGAGIGVNFRYDIIAGAKDALTEARNLQDKVLFSYLLESAPVGPGGAARTVYSGVRFGPAPTAYTRFGYSQTPSSGPLSVVVTYPDMPANPMYLSLDRTRGLVLSKRFASCPAAFYEATYHQSGNLRGLLDTESTTSQCGLTPITTEYNYGPDGAITGASQSGLDADGNFFSLNQVLNYSDFMAANGVRLARQTYQREQSGMEKLMTYTPQGRLTGIRNLTDNIELSIDYDYWTPNALVRSVTSTLPNGRIDREEYSSDGLLRTVTTAYGSANSESSSSYFYDAMRRPSGTMDVRGAMRDFAYLPDGRLQSVSLTASDGSEGVQSVMTYDTGFPELVEQITTTAQRGGQSVSSFVTNTLHDSVPLVQSVIRGGSNATPVTTRAFTYDSATWRPTRSCVNEVASSDQGCTTFNFFPTSSGYLSSMLRSLDVNGGILQGGFNKSLLYSPSGAVVGYQHQDAQLIKTNRWTLDSFGRVIEERRNEGAGSGVRTSSNRYNARGLPVSTKVFLDGTIAADLSIDYDQGGASNRPIFIYDAVTGTYHQFSYADPLKRLTGHIATYGGMRGYELQISSNSYDLFDRPRVFGEFIDGLGMRTRRLAFNNTGDLIRQINSNGQATEYSYDSFGRMREVHSPLVSITHDFDILAGKTLLSTVVENRTSNAGLRMPEHTLVTLDGLERPITEQNIEANDKHDLTYNSRGWIERINSNFGDATPNQEIRFVYDGAGHVVESFLNNQIVARKFHSGMGNIIRTDDGFGRPTLYTYDNSDRVTSVKFPDLTTWTLLTSEFMDGRYNGGISRRTTERDRAGAIATREFNQYGQPLRTSISGGPLPPSSIVRDYYGTRLTSVQRTSGMTESAYTSFSYDALGRPNREDTATYSPLGSFYQSIGKRFNQIGQLIEHQYLDDMNTVVTYHRDWHGRINSISMENYQFALEVANYNYDGPVLVSSNLGDVRRELTFDSSTRLLNRVKDSVGSLSLLDLNFTYDARSRIKQRYDLGFRRGTLNNLKEEFEYSSSDMLSRYYYQGAVVGTGDVRYEPNRDSILQAAQPGIDINFKLPSRFSYDLYGNPIREVSNNRTFTWERAGMEVLKDPATGTTANFLQDAMGRNIFYRKSRLGRNREVQQLRERGMVLTQREVNR